MVENKFQKLKRLQPHIDKLTKLGVLSINVNRNIEMVEKFLSRPEACKECRYRWLAEIYGFESEQSVKTIVLDYLK